MEDNRFNHWFYLESMYFTRYHDGFEMSILGVIKSFLKNNLATFNFIDHFLECKEGWFGFNSSHHCTGHGKDFITYNDVTGLCDTGCDAGWTEALCDKGDYVSKMPQA